MRSSFSVPLLATLGTSIVLPSGVANACWSSRVYTRTYYDPCAVSPPMQTDFCVPATCATAYRTVNIERCYYEPQTVYETRCLMQPQVSYIRRSYFDPATCCYRTYLQPVTTCVARSYQVPVTTYVPRRLSEPRTFCVPGVAPGNSLSSPGAFYPSVPESSGNTPASIPVELSPEAGEINRSKDLPKPKPLYQGPTTEPPPSSGPIPQTSSPLEASGNRRKHPVHQGPKIEVRNKQLLVDALPHPQSANRRL